MDRQRPLTAGEAKNLMRGACVWLEEAWASKPMFVKVTDNSDTVISFGKAWRGYVSYNRRDDGWRLWEQVPTPTERAQAKWQKPK